MSKKPSKIEFFCEECLRRVTPRRLQRNDGMCHKCPAETTWTLRIYFSEVEVRQNFLGQTISFLYGLGWRNIVTHTSLKVIEGITSEVALALTNDKKKMNSKVVEYLRLRSNQQFQRQGAERCSVCHVQFMPHSDKKWNQQGYCSIMCAAQDGRPEHLDASEQSVARQAISVVCPNGHTFEVMLSYSGCRRPCTECGAKSQVP